MNDRGKKAPDRQSRTERRRWAGVVMVAVVLVMALIIWNRLGNVQQTSRNASAPLPVIISLKPGTNFRDRLVDGSPCNFCPEMVVIPAGEFLMGSPEDEAGRNMNEHPQHRVRIEAPFAIGRHEITFEEWDACSRSGSCRGYEPDDSGWGRGTRPVVNVSWRDARNYARWLSNKTGEIYRLPSEAEWEYSARAGTTTAFWFGNTISTDEANFDPRVGFLNENFPIGPRTRELMATYGSDPDGTYRGETVPVGTFPANSFGLHDMHGNVAEWVRDCLGPYSVSTVPSDGRASMKGNCRRRVVRGGGWHVKPWAARSAQRNYGPPDYRGTRLGFRLVREL